MVGRYQILLAKIAISCCFYNYIFFYQTGETLDVFFVSIKTYGPTINIRKEYSIKE